MALKGYEGYSGEAADAEKEEVDRVFGSPIIRWKEGRNIVRVLPPPAGTKWGPKNTSSPFKMIWMHFIDVPHREKPVVFPCPRRNHNKPCPACVKAEELRSMGEEGYQRSRRVWPKRVWYANAIDRKDEEKGVQLIACGKEIMDQIVGIRREMHDVDPNDDFTDPYEGLDLTVNRSGTKKDDTEYTVQTRGRKSSPIADDEEKMQELIDKQINLQAKHDEMLTPELILGMLRGEGGATPAARESKRKAVNNGSNGQRSLPRTAEDDEDPENFIDTEAHDVGAQPETDDGDEGEEADIPW